MPDVKHRSPWLIIVLIVLCIGAGAYYFMQVNNETPENKATAKKAVEAVGRLDAAIGIGINFLDYTRLLQDAAAAIENYNPSQAIGKSTKASLVKAVRYYKAAHEAWHASINERWIDENMDSPSHWVDYPELNIPSSGPVPYSSELRQRAWTVAGKAYRDAKTAASSN
jgi:uncharacterized protein (UPF0333 family)